MATGEATAAKVDEGDLAARRREEQRLERAKRDGPTILIGACGRAGLPKVRPGQDVDDPDLRFVSTLD